MRYILRRIVVSILVIWVVITISFFLVKTMPGNPAEALYYHLLQQGHLTIAQIKQEVASVYVVMPHGPIWKQYLQYIWQLLHGNFGTSIDYTNRTVLSIIGNAIPWTVMVVTLALILSFVIGISIGIIMGYAPRSVASKVTTIVMTILNAIPNYLVALLLIYLLADLHPIFPIAGAYTPGIKVGLNGRFIFSVIRHAALPLASSVITSLGGWALAMKGSVSMILGGEYVTAARARGVHQRTILRSYVGHNAMLPLATRLALSIGFMFGGSVFIESLFAYPGIGYYLVTSVSNRDYPLMLGCFILIATAVVASNFIVDLLYPFIDPRVVRLTQQAAGQPSWLGRHLRALIRRGEPETKVKVAGGVGGGR